MKCEICGKEHTFQNYDSLTPSQKRNLDIGHHHTFSEGFKGCLIENERVIEVYTELSRFQIVINASEPEEKKKKTLEEAYECDQLEDEDNYEDW
jgi:hypothetical protein